MRILGLDISTAIIGVALLETDQNLSDPKILLLDHIEFKGCETLWEKADVAKKYLNVLSVNALTPGLKWKMRSPDMGFDDFNVCIEESLKSFRPGFSSASTITLLAKFNGLLSFFARDSFCIDPTYIAATTARKTCGIKIKKTSVAGINAKDQTFEWCMNGPLAHVQWPKKKSGKIVDWAKDVTDAYCIARAGLILNT